LVGIFVTFFNGAVAQENFVAKKTYNIKKKNPPDHSNTHAV